jgi:hypothetical protein
MQKNSYLGGLFETRAENQTVAVGKSAAERPNHIERSF